MLADPDFLPSVSLHASESEQVSHPYKILGGNVDMYMTLTKTYDIYKCVFLIQYLTLMISVS
jgi:hypothetical protein